MCVPSFILRLIEYAEMNGIDYRNSSIRRIIGIGEGLREQDFSLNLLGNRIKGEVGCRSVRYIFLYGDGSHILGMSFRLRRSCAPPN